jgi:hypothetical protein
MTKAEKATLQRDMRSPEDLFTLVAENNPVALSNAFQSWGYTYSGSSVNQMITELVRMYNAGGQPRQQAMQLAGSVPYQFGVFPIGYDEAILGGKTPARPKSSDGGGNSGDTWYSDINWGDVIGEIFGGVSGIIGATRGQPGAGTQPVTDVTDDVPDTIPNNNTMMYVIIGGVALLIVVAILATRK